MFKHKEIFNIKKTFYILDKDFTGAISRENLKEGLLQYEKEVGSQLWDDIDQEVTRIFENVDFNQDGEINYTEFVCATLDQTNHLT
mmetsp:Transcript_5108/g.4674  ORF Transcript_5108/g.4674 Transcript_5108/m.4674 type:complete len:86 (-) Transcript_5108:309-566(-)